MQLNIHLNSTMRLFALSLASLYLAACGGGSPPPGSPFGVDRLALFVGSVATNGSTDGTGSIARFLNPGAIAADASGNLYLTDTGNHTIRKITPTGVVTTLAGTAAVIGTADGTGIAASFNTPSGVATDTAGNVYVADTFNHTIRKITAAGVVTTWAGTVGAPGSLDGTGTAAQFSRPVGLAMDAAGYMYVADTDNHTIRKINLTTVAVITLAGTAGVRGSNGGTGAAAQFNQPTDLVTDATNNVYVADNVNHMIRKITPAGVVTTLAGTAGLWGSADGAGTIARFYSPRGLAIDTTGNLYVADTFNYTIRKITPIGDVTTVVGTAGTPVFTAGALPGGIPPPMGVVVDGAILYMTAAGAVLGVTPLP